MQVLGFNDLCRLTPLRRLYPLPVRQASIFASGFLQIRSHPRHPCLWLTLPLAGCVEDLHLQVTSVATTAKLVALARNAPCLAHQKKTASAKAEAAHLSALTGHQSSLAAVRKRDEHADKPPRSPTHVLT